jgi:hypothetical protein
MQPWAGYLPVPIRQCHRRVYKFFTKLGMKTVWSNELYALRDTLSARQQEGDKTVPDLLTGIRL